MVVNNQVKTNNFGLLIAWLVALAATLTVLYLSEIIKMPVCLLCWYQRSFMFPLAIILGIATFKNDSNVVVYSIPIAVLGALIALYHYLIQMIPTLAPYTPCRANATGVSCEQIDWQLFGFITFPLLSLAAFLAVLIALVYVAVQRKGN